MDTVRWNISISADVDRSLRMHLAESGRGKKGDLSKFVEDAVKRLLFDQRVAELKDSTAHLSEAEVSAGVDEAVAWARSQKRPKRKRECV